MRYTRVCANCDEFVTVVTQGHVLAPLIVRCVQDRPRHPRRTENADITENSADKDVLLPRPYVKEILLNLLLVHADMR